MKSIEEVFSANLRRLRGERSQEAMAEAVHMPIASYQRAEGGAIPKSINLRRLVEALGVPETHLFVDTEEFQPKHMTALEALKVIEQALRACDAPQAGQPDLSHLPADIIASLAQARDPAAIKLLRQAAQVWSKPAVIEGNVSFGVDEDDVERANRPTPTTPARAPRRARRA